MSISQDPERIISLIGKLHFGTAKEVIPILAGTSLENLRQGAGYYHRSAPFGEIGTSIIIGHRESVFYNLGDLRQDDIITIEVSQKKFSYRVKDTRIAEKIDEYFLIQKTAAQLLLVTCYPIKLTGPIMKRYLVLAEMQ